MQASVKEKLEETQVRRRRLVVHEAGNPGGRGGALQLAADDVLCFGVLCALCFVFCPFSGCRCVCVILCVAARRALLTAPQIKGPCFFSLDGLCECLFDGLC